MNDGLDFPYDTQEGLPGQSAQRDSDELTRGEKDSWRKMREYLAYKQEHPGRLGVSLGNSAVARFFRAKRNTILALLAIFALFGVLPLILLTNTPMNRWEVWVTALGTLIVVGGPPATFAWCYNAEHGERFSLRTAESTVASETKHDDKGHDLSMVSQCVSNIETTWSESTLLANRMAATDAVSDYNREVSGRCQAAANEAARYVLGAYWQGRDDVFSSEVAEAAQWLADALSAFGAMRLSEVDPKIRDNMDLVMDRAAEAISGKLDSLPMKNHAANNMTPEEFLEFTAQLAAR